MPSQDELLQALRNADKAGDKAAATRIAQLLQAKGATPEAPPAAPASAAPAAPEMSTLDKLGSVAKGAGKELIGQVGQLGARGIIAAQPFKSEDISKVKEYASHPGQIIGDIGSGLSSLASGASDFVTGLFHPGETPEELEKFGGRATQAVEGVVGGGLAAREAFAGRAAETFTKGELRGPEIQRHEVAARTAKLPASDALETPAGADLDSQIRDVAKQRYERLKSAQSVVGDKAFERYFTTGEQIEAGGPQAYFTQSPSGIKLIQELKDIEGSTAGEDTKFSVAMRKKAKKLREALSGIGGDERRPVNLRVVDEELRDLLDKGHDTSPFGFRGVQRKRFLDLADKLQNAVKEWVGEENYPRAEYKAVSEDLNRFGSDLGRALTEREDIKYVKPGESPFKVKKGLAERAFDSPESARDFKTIVGEQKFNEFAERHLSNVMRKKGTTAAGAMSWMDENAQLLKQVPGLESKALTYAQHMAEQEGDAAALEKIRKRWSSLKKYAAYAAAGAAGGGAAYAIMK
jgi:hypothetical protein